MGRPYYVEAYVRENGSTRVVGYVFLSTDVVDIPAYSGKPIVTLHDPDTTHALKEIDRAAMATAETPEQVVDVLSYVLEGKLPAGA